MHTLTFALTLLFVFSKSFGQSKQQEWVDPYDMNVGLEFTTSRQYKQETCVCPEVKTTEHALLHYKRVISLLTNSLFYDSGQYKGVIHVNLSEDDYNFLTSISKKSDVEEKEFRKLDLILSSVLVKPRHEQLAEILVSWTDSFYFTFYNKTTGILLSSVFLLYASYKLLRAQITLRMVVKYLIFLAWVVDFAFTWAHLLQEEEINKMADTMRYKTIPAYCDPNKMTWWEFLKSVVSSQDECRQYHQVLYQSAFYKISPFTVISHQIGIIIVKPLTFLGQAVGLMTSSILSSLPPGLNYILLPLLLVFIGVIMCLVLSSMTQTSFEVSFFHLLKFHFGGDRRNISDTLTGRNLSKFLDFVHQRNAVEDVEEIEDVSRRSDENTPKKVKGNRSELNQMRRKCERDENKVVCDKTEVQGDGEMGIEEDQGTSLVKLDGSGDAE